MLWTGGALKDAAGSIASSTIASEHFSRRMMSALSISRVSPSKTLPLALLHVSESVRRVGISGTIVLIDSIGRTGTSGFTPTFS
jgi:hypothetical protein